MIQTKTLASHLNRLAVIYIRQSSPLQVEQSTESRYRQYQLAERASEMGWPAQRCVVIDDDLGISGANSYNRPGYQRLVSMVALRQVGIILGLEVSRLARNCLDWYQLLEVAAAFDVLIADEDGVYDPADFNDRMLLGLKGTFSEIERYQIRARMLRARLNKARRGELAVQLPVGFEYDVATGKVRLSVDQSVRHAIAAVFHLFRQLGSVRSVLVHLHREGLELPYKAVNRGLGSKVLWRRPSYDHIYNMLINPVYAGVYCYGKRKTRDDPVAQKRQVVRVDRSEWEVVIPEHHEGYISYSQFGENIETLRNNSYAFEMSQGAPREGPALLQGLAYCQHCGLRMRVRYHMGSAYYCCDRDQRRFGERVCCWASAKRVDAVVEELLLGVLNEGTLELSLEHERKLQEEERQTDRQWREKLQRLEYESNIARRRYELVDPENRLVARTLETDWNAKLAELEVAKQEYQRRDKRSELSSTLEEMREMVSNLSQYWHGGGLEPQDKKDLIRCVVERVFLRREKKVIKVEVAWFGGARSELDVPKYLFTPGRIYHRVVELARSHTDAEIAEILDAEGSRTVKGRRWTARRIMDFRLSNGIASGLTASRKMRMHDSGYVRSSEVAEGLGVHQSTVQRWFQLGVLEGKQDGEKTQLWINWTPEIAKRLDGSAAPRTEMVSVRRLCADQNKHPDEILLWSHSQGHEIFRLRRGSSFRFYVLPRNP